MLRAGTYTLYCDHVDQYVVIEPDARPGWEVKVLHVEGLALSKGQRVEAGVTRLAAHARVLPFPSRWRSTPGLPPWPHVHVEVVDPTVPDRPTEPPCTDVEHVRAGERPRQARKASSASVSATRCWAAVTLPSRMVNTTNESRSSVRPSVDAVSRAHPVTWSSLAMTSTTLACRVPPDAAP